MLEQAYMHSVHVRNYQKLQEIASIKSAHARTKKDARIDKEIEFFSRHPFWVHCFKILCVLF